MFAPSTMGRNHAAHKGGSMLKNKNISVYRVRNKDPPR